MGGCINFTIIVIIISWIDPLRITIMVCDDGRVVKSVPLATIVDHSNSNRFDPREWYKYYFLNNNSKDSKRSIAKSSLKYLIYF